MDKMAFLLGAAVALNASVGAAVSWPACVTVVLDAPAGLRTANIFGDNMVLRRDVEVPVWGWAAPGEAVTVSFKGQSVSGVADVDGKWTLKLAPMEADAAGAEMQVRTATARKVLKDILVGEVWLCSGQSNMQFALRELPDGEKQVAAARHPQMRLLTVSSPPSDIPVDDIDAKDKWQVCAPETAAEFSAVGYFFGRELSGKLGVPVGLIDNARGGTLAEAWTSHDALKAEKTLKAVFARHAKLMEKEAFTRRVVQWRQDLDTWNKLSAEERGKWPVVVKWWRRIAPPYGYPGNSDAPSWLFNSLVNPLIPFAISGVIWYQGETNVPRGKEYGVLFPALIKDWRKRWGQGDFPFYFVQIAPCREFVGHNLPDLWVAQYRTAETVGNCGMVSPIDVGDIETPHPLRKEPVGKRLANFALAETYGVKGLAYKSPAFKAAARDGGKVRISFKDLGGTGLRAHDGKALSWFAVAGDDGEFLRAEAVIDGDTVLVSCPRVKTPKAVRFAWDNLAEPNLGAGNGLPVLPFAVEVGE